VVRFPKFGKAENICWQRIRNRDENFDFPYLLTSATDTAGGKWKLSRITGSQGEKTTLEYDAQGNLTKTVSPDGGLNRWWYDEWGQCSVHKNAKEGLTKYEYDLWVR
jgi:YD repeat-containing protein